MKLKGLKHIQNTFIYGYWTIKAIINVMGKHVNAYYLNSNHNK